uniref:Uncharacterized protein n=1 Tax=Parascaris univalens TaxID=6257 RepID=A0A915BXY2_PARUN
SAIYLFRYPIFSTRYHLAGSQNPQNSPLPSLSLVPLFHFSRTADENWLSQCIVVFLFIVFIWYNDIENVTEMVKSGQLRLKVNGQLKRIGNIELKYKYFTVLFLRKISTILQKLPTPNTNISTNLRYF